jgi:hypothetical protein
MQFISKILGIIFILSLLISCHKRINQNSMFNGRSHKNKKGVYDAGMKKNTPISVQLKKDYDKLSKYDTDPKKARKAQDKEMAKKKKAAAKARSKNNKKRHVKVKTTKGKTSGEQ